MFIWKAFRSGSFVKSLYRLKAYIDLVYIAPSKGAIDEVYLEGELEKR